MKMLDWNAKARYAKTLTLESLLFAERDCIDSARCFRGTDLEGYYHDEASVYRSERLARIAGLGRTGK